MSCAYYLARGGARVTLLERDHVGAGASWGNAGTVSAGHPPLNRPGRVRDGLRQMLDPTSPLYIQPRVDVKLWKWLYDFAIHCTDDHVEHAMRIMAPLGKEAFALFTELVHEERIQCGYRPEGYFDVCSTESGLDGARHEAGIIERYGYHPEHLDGEELRRREPAFSESVIGGVYYPEAAILQPSRFLTSLADALLRHGGAILEGVDVREVRVVAGRVTGVRTTASSVTDNSMIKGDSLGADVVVLATGPFSLAMARVAGARLPVQPGKGYHRDIEIGPNGAPALNVACVLSESSVFCTPMDTFVRFAGTMEFSGSNHVMRHDRLRQLTTAAREAFPALGSARPNSEWVGLRPMSADGLPIVGPLGDVEGLVVATGHGMLGLTLGPLTGQMVANQVLGGEEPRLEGLSPDRFR